MYRLQGLKDVSLLERCPQRVVCTELGLRVVVLHSVTDSVLCCLWRQTDHSITSSDIQGHAAPGDWLV